MHELLRIESTSLRIKDLEKSKETEKKLASNKAALQTKFFNVVAGRDNRWSELHPTRFLLVQPALGGGITPRPGRCGF
jgi:hypothetical protein